MLETQDLKWFSFGSLCYFCKVPHQLFAPQLGQPVWRYFEKNKEVQIKWNVLSDSILGQFEIHELFFVIGHS